VFGQIVTARATMLRKHERKTDAPFISIIDFHYYNQLQYDKPLNNTEHLLYTYICLKIHISFKHSNISVDVEITFINCYSMTKYCVYYNNFLFLLV
jgi:hypothetical protein